MSRWLPILIFFTALSAHADRVADEVTRVGIAEFTAAYRAWDGKQFAQAVETFRRSTTNQDVTVTNFYWLGAAEFHQMLELQNSPSNSTNRRAAEAAMDAAVGALADAVKLDDRHAESHALLGTLYGMKINGNLLRAAWFGPRVAKHRELALKYGAENPRVQYLLGMCEFHTAKRPAAWREALTTLLTAEKLFETEARIAPAPLEPRWGYDTCLTFIGRTYETLGQPDKAGEYYRKALAMHPADHLAKQGLERIIKQK